MRQTRPAGERPAAPFAALLAAVALAIGVLWPSTAPWPAGTSWPAVSWPGTAWPAVAVGLADEAAAAAPVGAAGRVEAVGPRGADLPGWVRQERVDDRAGQLGVRHTREHRPSHLAAVLPAAVAVALLLAWRGVVRGRAGAPPSGRGHASSRAPPAAAV